MIRILILASIGATVSATPYFSNYPLGLESLFGRKREAVGANTENESAVCESEACKFLAKTIRDGIDDSVDPCDDFYQYACGKWDQKNPVPENETTWGLWDMVESKIRNQVKGLMEAPIEQNDLFAVKLAKKWYQTCTNEVKEDTDEIAPIVATLWRHGGWPLIMEKGEWDDRIYNWQIVDDHYARLTGMNAFYDLFFTQISYDSNETLILDSPHLPMGMYKLISEPYQGSDTSDENNESGEGSQENGSKETFPKPDEDEDDDEDEDEGIEEDNEPETEEEELKARRVSRRRNHKRLGHNKRSSSKHSVGRKHRGTHLRRRPKRNVIHEIVFHKVRSAKKRANKHGVHHKSRKTGRKSPRHKHIPLAVQKKSSSEKNDMKRSEKINKTNVKPANKKKHAVHKKRVTNEEENEGLRRKNRIHRHGHENKSVHGSHQHKQRILGRHRVHHVARKMEEKETDEAPNDNENEDNSSDNDVETGSNEDDDNTNDEENDDNDDNTNDEENSNDDDDEDEEGNNDDDDDEEEEDDDEEDDDEDEDEKTVEELTEIYKKYMLSVAEEFIKVRGVEIPRDKLEKDTDALIKFSIKVGEVAANSKFELENMTLSEFQEWYEGLGHSNKNSKVNWKRKILKVFTEAGLEPEDELNVTIPYLSYFESIGNLLEETPTDVIVNYIHWDFISKFGYISSLKIQELAKDWDPMRSSDREQMCMNVELSDVIGYEYTKKHFPPKLERMARDMIDDIQKEVEYQIKESTWLDDDTKHFILDKLVHLQHLVGSPDWYQNTTMVHRYFQGLTIGTSYFENVVNYIRYMRWKQFRRAFFPDEYPSLSMDPLMVNAFFMPTENVIAISAADLQNPLFDATRPWNSNFGIIGSIMAHEVNHGFDDSGHLYDRTGKPTEWLSAMASAYNKRAECFVDQFNNYEIIKGDSFRVKDYGNQTAGENIADTMGLEAVFRAYHRRLRACKNPDPALPGLEKYNNNQTFFLSYASLWCEAQDPEYLKNSAKYDVHSPGRLRIIGPLSNMDGFAKSFNCPAGSPMNPEKKCNIWQ